MKLSRRHFALGVAVMLACTALLYLQIYRNNESELGSPEDTAIAREAISAPYNPPSVSDTQLATFVDRRNPLNERMARSLSSQGHKIEVRQDIEALMFVLNDKQDDSTARNEALNLLRSSAYRPRLAEHLIRLVNDPYQSEQFRGYCVQHLMYAARDAKDAEQRKQLVDELRSLQIDSSLEVKTRALTALTLLGEADALEGAVELLLDEEQPVELRGEAVRTIWRFRAAEHIPTLRTLAAKGDWRIRRAAIAALGQFRDKESMPIFKEALGASEPLLKRAAQVALRDVDKPPVRRRPLR